LLLTEDPVRADRLASELSRLNAKRQRSVEEMLRGAQRAAAAKGTTAHLLVVGGDDWSPGLVGLVAGKLTERFNRPTIALSVGAETSRGSARSIAGFNIVEALAACQDILVEHGGHSQAAGLTVLTKDLVELEARLIELATQTFGGSPPPPALDIDAEISGRELNLATARLIEQLEPFGQGNPAPRLMIRSARVVDARPTRNGKHLQFQVETASGAIARAIFFDGAPEIARLVSRKPVDLVFELKVDNWNGRGQPVLEILDYSEPERFAVT
jgi:single-stranded-DNA-specific exonuclease